MAKAKSKSVKKKVKTAVKKKAVKKTAKKTVKKTIKKAKSKAKAAAKPKSAVKKKSTANTQKAAKTPVKKKATVKKSPVKTKAPVKKKASPKATAKPKASPAKKTAPTAGIDELRQLAIDQLNSHSCLVHTDVPQAAGAVRDFVSAHGIDDAEFAEAVRAHNDDVYKARADEAADLISMVSDDELRETVFDSFFNNPSNADNPYADIVRNGDDSPVTVVAPEAAEADMSMPAAEEVKDKVPVDPVKEGKLKPVREGLDKHKYLVYTDIAQSAGPLKDYISEYGSDDDALMHAVEEHNDEVYKERAARARDAIAAYSDFADSAYVYKAFFNNPSNADNPYSGEVKTAAEKNGGMNGLTAGVSLNPSGDQAAKTKKNNMMLYVILGSSLLFVLLISFVVFSIFRAADTMKSAIRTTTVQRRKYPVVRKVEDDPVREITSIKKKTVVRKNSRKAAPARKPVKTLNSKVIHPKWGDTLTEISSKYYGKGELWPHLFFDNIDTITSPDRLVPVRDRVVITYNTNADLGELYFRLFEYYKEKNQKTASYRMLHIACCKNLDYVRDNAGTLSDKEKSVLTHY